MVTLISGQRSLAGSRFTGDAMLTDVSTIGRALIALIPAGSTEGA